MRPQKQLKQSAEEILPHLEEAGSSTKGQATAVGPPMAAPASPPRPEPDLATPPRLSVPDRQQLLKDSVEFLRQQGLIDLQRIAQDGMRVRASAGAASFRRRETPIFAASP